MVFAVVTVLFVVIIYAALVASGRSEDRDNKFFEEYIKKEAQK